MQRIQAIQGSANVIQFRGRQVAATFTSRDLFELQHWGGRDYRVEIDRMDDADGLRQFAMIYEDDRTWASWALTRHKGEVLVWDCVSLADLGRFETMRQALAALPGDSEDILPSLPAQVISLREAAARRASV